MNTKRTLALVAGLVLGLTLAISINADATGAIARYFTGTTMLDAEYVKLGAEIHNVNTAANTTLAVLALQRDVDGATAGADSLGASITWALETETQGTSDPAAVLSVSWSDATANSTDSDMTFSIRAADATLAAMKLASPGVLQVYAGGTVPAFSVATLAGELGVGGDAEIDANLDVAGTCNFSGATVTLGDASGDAVVSNSGAWSFPNDVTITVTHLGVSGEVHGGTLVSTGLTTAATLAVTTPTTVEYLLSSTAAVDVSGVAEHVLYTVPAGKTAIITKQVIRSCSGTLDMATDAVVQFGCNAGVHNDVIAAKTLTAPTASTGYQTLIPTAENGTGNVQSTMCVAASEYTASVTTSATTSTTCVFDTWGYLF
jgi:hypothetical protein